MCIAGDVGEYHAPTLSPSGVRTFVKECGKAQSRVLVIEASGRVRSLDAYGVRSQRWVDDETLLVSDIEGMVRLLGVDGSSALLGEGEML